LLNDIEKVTISLKSLPNLKTLKYPIKKSKEAVLVENLANLTLLNNLHIIRQPGKKPLPLQYLNEGVLEDFKKEILKQFNQIKVWEETYLSDQTSKALIKDQEDKFVNEVNEIIAGSMRKIKEKDGDVMPGLEELYFIKTKYEIYELIRTQCLDVGMDYYAGLGKLMKEVSDIQNNLFDATIKEALKLVNF
jgi:hypothetical protein